MTHELEKYVRKNATYRLESWHFVSQMHTLGIFLFLLLAIYSNNLFVTGFFIYTILMTVWSLSRYTAEWTRIAKQHPDWANPEKEDELFD